MFHILLFIFCFILEFRCSKHFNHLAKSPTVTLSILSTSCTSFGKVSLSIHLSQAKELMELEFLSGLVCLFPIKSLNYCFLKQHLHSSNGFSFLWFLCKFFATIPFFYIYKTSPPYFIALSSQTFSNPLSLRLCICVSLSLPVITFCSLGYAH